MKKLFFFIFLAISLGIRAQYVNIPDANFKAILLSSSPSNTVAKNLTGNYFAIDANNDGEIQITEAVQVGELEILNLDPNFTNNPIQDYQGILSFINVKNISINSWNVPGNLLDINNLNFLESLNINFGNYDPGLINLNNCTALKNVYISGIGITQLSNIPLTENLTIGNYYSLSSTALNDIANLSNLKNLQLIGYENQTLGQNLNLSGHQKLTSLKILSTSLNVNVSNCALLQNITLDLSIDALAPSTEVNINSSNCPNLAIYNVSQTSDVVANIISNNCPSLTNFISSNAGSVSLSLNDCVNLQTIDVRYLTEISVNNCTNLTSIKAEKGYQNSTFNLSNSNLPNLEYISLFHPIQNPAFPTGNSLLTTINLEGISSLKELHVANHEILNLNVQGCAGLLVLDCSNNELTSLNIKNGSNESLNFAGNPNLQTICCDGNQLTNVQQLANSYGYNSTVSTDCTTLTSDEKNLKNSIKLYPNPTTKGEVNINADYNIKSIKIIDQQGKVIQKQAKINAKSTTVKLQSLPSGIYYFKIITEKDTMIKKVIVK